MRAHLSLNVKSVPESVAFYSKLFGVGPQKQNSTYAKFDLKEPALNFAMQSSAEKVSHVSHLGIEVDSLEQLKQWEEKLISAGLIGKPEQQSNCCFARQDKLWFQDPDGNAWEVFHVYEQLPVTESNKTQCCG